jgi:hypothetical protein
MEISPHRQASNGELARSAAETWGEDDVREHRRTNGSKYDTDALTLAVGLTGKAERD